MLNKKSRAHALRILTFDVQKEMKFLCSKRANSLLRATSAKKLSTFTWDLLAEELESKAPTLFAGMCQCATKEENDQKQMCLEHNSSWSLCWNSLASL